MRAFCNINKRFVTSNSKLHEPKKFEKILIANRGEIALRVMRTAKKMDIKCVAVFSEADKHSQHVKMADEAILIGPSPSSESYLKFERVLEAMKQTGSEAVHPGYGFLSENFKFAEVVENSGLNFIGPPSSAIKSMGSKSESKTIMTAAGVPCIPGYHGENQDPEYLATKAEEMGYPIMIKAVLGGGGKGMRVASNREEFAEKLQSAKRESLKSFGDDRVLLEKFIKRSRHIEVQVFADKHGNCVYLFERDCSIQRRNQKIIEEAPAHGLSDELRRKLGETAVKAAKAVNYVGPGTVEFIYDCSDNSFYFMEMNTRLQVEHPVTEMITGQDLVEWQLNAAAGFKLPLKQDELHIKGHSIEARIYAEIPERNFIPDTGKLLKFKYPSNTPELRVETGVQNGDEISIFYDPMIAKVITGGRNRNEAMTRLDLALSELLVSGVNTNIQFIQRILRTGDFKKSDIDTNFIEIHSKKLFDVTAPPFNIIFMAAATRLLSEISISNGKFDDPFSHFRLGSLSHNTIDLVHNGKDYPVVLIALDKHSFSFKYPDGTIKIATVMEHTDDYLRMLIGTEAESINYHINNNTATIWSKRYGRFDFNIKSTDHSGRESEKESNSAGGRVISAMPCKINQILVRCGDTVKVGTPLCVTEAMKMELIIKSKVDGVVKQVHFAEGDIVPEKSLLMEIEAKTE